MEYTRILNEVLKLEFNGINEIRGNFDNREFEILLKSNVKLRSILLKSLHAYLHNYIQAKYGDKYSYYFTVVGHSGQKELLVFNDPDTEYWIDIKMNGENKKIRILDSRGACSFKVYDENFNYLGHFFDPESGASPCDDWHTEEEQLRPYLGQILSKMYIFSEEYHLAHA